MVLASWAAKVTGNGDSERGPWLTMTTMVAAHSQQWPVAKVILLEVASETI